MIMIREENIWNLNTNLAVLHFKNIKETLYVLVCVHVTALNVAFTELKKHIKNYSLQKENLRKGV